MVLICLVFEIVKNCERFEIHMPIYLTYLQINYSGCDSFMDTSKRHEAPDSETRDSLLLKVIVVARLPEFSCKCFPILSFHRTM